MRKALGSPGTRGRDVVGHHVRHAVEVDQPIAGGEVDARLPLFAEQRDFIEES